MEELQKQFQKWFKEQIPGTWFQGDLEVSADGQEILVVGKLAEPAYPKGKSTDEKQAMRLSGIRDFREETREERMKIASKAERLFNRKVSWGVRCGEAEVNFTGLGVPVMTRLRLKERALLDTLVAAGVARSRSEALAWCTSLVASKQKDWLESLKEATKQVAEVRRRGPGGGLVQV